MASVNSEVLEIVGRCRRIGWDVETADGRQDWAYRVHAPDGTRVQLHATPSDRNWRHAVMRQLDASGFSKAEQEWIEKDEVERQKRIAADRKKAERATAAALARTRAHDAARELAAGPLAIRDVDAEWLLTPAAVPETRAVRIGPDVAAKLLATINTSNRKMKTDNVKALTSSMEAGEFAHTHQGAAIDSNGVLQDGQQRMQAIVNSGATVTMNFTVGVDPSNFGKVDTGAMRRASDVAFMRGEVNVNTYSATARFLLAVDVYGAEVHLKGPKTKIPVDRVDRHALTLGEPLRIAVARAHRIRRELKANPTGLAASIFMITDRLPPGDPRVEAYFEDFESGVGITREDPIWALRRLFIRARDVRSTYSQYEVAAHVIKAWNQRAAGRKGATVAVWRSNEMFPDVLLPAPIVDQRGATEAA